MYNLAEKNSHRMIWEAQDSKRIQKLMEETMFKLVKQMAQSALDVISPTSVKGENGNIVAEDAPMR